MAQMVKHLPAMQETWVRPLGQKDPLEKEMATHSSTLAWKIPWAAVYALAQNQTQLKHLSSSSSSSIPYPLW